MSDEGYNILCLQIGRHPVKGSIMAKELPETEDSVDDIIAGLTDEQCHALYQALKQKYEPDEDEPDDEAKDHSEKNGKEPIAPEDVKYGFDMVP